MYPDLLLVKSGCDWLILVSTMIVHFLPFILQWMGLTMFTGSFLFSLETEKEREKVIEIFHMFMFLFWSTELCVLVASGWLFLVGWAFFGRLSRWGDQWSTGVIGWERVAEFLERGEWKSKSSTVSHTVQTVKSIDPTTKSLVTPSKPISYISSHPLEIRKTVFR